MRPRLLSAFRSGDARLLVRAVAALVFVSALFSVAVPAPAATGLPQGVHCLGPDTGSDGPPLPADHGCAWCVTTTSLSAPPPPVASERLLAGDETIAAPGPSGAGPSPAASDDQHRPRAPPVLS